MQLFETLEDKRISLDVDGLLSNFYLAICREYDKPLINMHSWSLPWISEIFHEIAKDKDFWASLPILTPPEAINFEVAAYITSIPEEIAQVRAAWLSLRGYPDAPVVVAHDKLKACITHDIDIHIDDKPKIIKELNESGAVTGIQFYPPYAVWEKVGPVIRNLHDFHKYVEWENKSSPA